MLKKEFYTAPLAREIVVEEEMGFLTLSGDGVDISNAWIDEDEADDYGSSIWQ